MNRFFAIISTLILTSALYSVELSDFDQIINSKLNKRLTYVWYDTDFYSTVDYPYNYLERKVYYQNKEGWVIDIDVQMPKDPYGNRPWTTLSKPLSEFLWNSVEQDCLIEIIIDNQYIKYDTDIASIKMDEIDKGIFDLSSNCKHQSLGIIVEENIQ